jgi:hypothetical protein
MPGNKLYLIGSLRNEKVPETASFLRSTLSDWEVFDDWYSAGPEADDFWKAYEKSKGHSYVEALAGYAADHVFHFDKHHLDTANAGILLLPAGRSGHLELGYLAGRNAYTAIVLTPDYEDERFDVMYKFATRVTYDLDDVVKDLRLFE